MKRTMALVVAMLLALGACGEGGAESAGPVTTRPDTITVSTTTPETPTTTAPSGTESEPGSGTATTLPETVTTTTSASTDAGDRFVDVWFIRDGASLVAVPRAVAGTAVARGAIEHLIDGPTATEQDEGLASAVPADTLLLGLAIADGTATVDLSQEFEAGGGSTNILGRLAQVVYTLTQFDSVERVSFHIDGLPVDLFSGEGVVLDEPVDRDDYAGVFGNDDPAGEPPTWAQDDLPTTDGPNPYGVGVVALVADDDVLNVRESAGVDADIIGMLVPGVTVRLTGESTMVGTSEWVEIDTPDGTGWVNRTYLAAAVPAEAFASDPEVIAALDQFSAALAAGGDISDPVSRRGLYVAHHAGPVRFGPEVLPGVMSDPTTYQWPSPALEPGSPEIPYRSFAEAVGDRFEADYQEAARRHDGTDATVEFNTIVEGPNGRLPEAAIPFELLGFNHVTVHDPGDDPQYGGLDWSTWYVSFDYEDGVPRIVALTIDEWAP